MKISQLDPENKKKALEYQKKYSNGYEDTDSIGSFAWNKTPEKSDYWFRLEQAILIDNDAEIIENERPSHYDNGTDKDVIDFCHDNNMNFCRGSAIKYIVRAGKKDDEIKDLQKAIDFLQREIKKLEKMR